MATTTSTYIGGVMTGYVTPTMVGATRAVGSPVRPIIGSGITAIAGCSTTSEGAPCAPASIYPIEGTGGA